VEYAWDVTASAEWDALHTRLEQYLAGKVQPQIAEALLRELFAKVDTIGCGGTLMDEVRAYLAAVQP
jgi:hypothetical protein